MAEQNVKTGVYSFKDEDVVFSFYTSITALQKAKFVKSVTDMIVGDSYLYIIKDLIFDLHVIDIFSDIDLDGMYDGDFELDLDEVEKFVNNTTVVDIIKLNAEDNAIEELKKAVELDIEYRTGIHKNPINESLASLIDTIEKKFSSFDVDGMMDMAQAFTGVTGELTPEKMLSAYANSNVFKNMHKDVASKQAKRDASINAIQANVIKGGKSVSESPLLSPMA